MPSELSLTLAELVRCCDYLSDEQQARITTFEQMLVFLKALGRLRELIAKDQDNLEIRQLVVWLADCHCLHWAVRYVEDSLDANLTALMKHPPQIPIVVKKAFRRLSTELDAEPAAKPSRRPKLTLELALGVLMSHHRPREQWTQAGSWEPLTLRDILRQAGVPCGSTTTAGRIMKSFFGSMARYRELCRRREIGLLKRLQALSREQATATGNAKVELTAARLLTSGLSEIVAEVKQEFPKRGAFSHP